MRTPEETARLANGVTVETPRGSFDVHAHVSTSGRLRCDFAWATAGAGRDTGAVLAVAIADLVEARAEVAALRGRVKMMREWQAAKREYEAARVEDERLFDLCQRSERNRHAYGPLFSTARTRRGTAHLALLSVEARLLAADLGEEVGHG